MRLDGRLGIPVLDALTGAGVFYGAAASEAKAVQGSEVFVVGGANSAIRLVHDYLRGT
jgi:thioredoxin reductase (NADPH)